MALTARSFGKDSEKFLPGDIVFGLASERETYFTKMGGRPSVFSTVDAYNNPFLGLFLTEYHEAAYLHIPQPYDKDAVVESPVAAYKATMEAHSHYSPLPRMEAESSQVNERIKDACKFGLEYFLGHPETPRIHFILDGIDADAVFSKGARDYNSRSFTASELRKLFRLWQEQPDAVRAKVLLWQDFKEVNIDEFMSRFVAVYTPKSRARHEEEAKARLLIAPVEVMCHIDNFPQVKALIDGLETVRAKIVAFKEYVHKRADLSPEIKYQAFVQLFMELRSPDLKTPASRNTFFEDIIMSALDSSYRSMILRNARLDFSLGMLVAADPAHEEHKKTFFGYKVKEADILAAIKARAVVYGLEEASKKAVVSGGGGAMAMPVVATAGALPVPGRVAVQGAFALHELGSPTAGTSVGTPVSAAPGGKG